MKLLNDLRTFRALSTNTEESQQTHITKAGVLCEHRAERTQTPTSKSHRARENVREHSRITKGSKNTNETLELKSTRKSRRQNDHIPPMTLRSSQIGCPPRRSCPIGWEYRRTVRFVCSKKRRAMISRRTIEREPGTRAETSRSVETTRYQR